MLLWVFGMATHGSGQTVNEGEKYFKAGYDFLVKNENEKAIENFTLSLKYLPEWDNTFHCRGYAYAQLGQYTLAIDDYSRSIQLNPGVGDVYDNRSWAYILTGDYNKAITDSHKAISLDQKAGYYNTRATARGLLKYYSTAADDFTKAISLQPKAIYYYKRGLIKKAYGKSSEAEQDFSAARKMDAQENFRKEKDPFFSFFTDQFYAANIQPTYTIKLGATEEAKDAKTTLLGFKADNEYKYLGNSQFKYHFTYQEAKTLCPPGYRLPTYADWRRLIENIYQEKKARYVDECVIVGHIGTGWTKEYFVEKVLKKETHEYYSTDTYKLNITPMGILDGSEKEGTGNKTGFWMETGRNSFGNEINAIVFTPYCFNFAMFNEYDTPGPYQLCVRCIKKNRQAFLIVAGSPVQVRPQVPMPM